jgi:hypothetical protein
MTRGQTYLINVKHETAFAPQENVHVDLFLKCQFASHPVSEYR